MSDRIRLRPAHSQEELARIYAQPHNHTKWMDHKVRVAVTATFAQSLLGHVRSVADLSCGDGAVLHSLTADRKFFGDFASGYPLTGPVDVTIDHIPTVDVFVCCETLEHLDDPDATLRRIRAKSKTLVLSTPVDAFADTNLEHYWAWSRAGVEHMLAEAGFIVVTYAALDFRPSGCDYQFGIWLAR